MGEGLCTAVSVCVVDECINIYKKNLKLNHLCYDEDMVIYGDMLL